MPTSAHDVSHWKLASKIEEGRNHVLRMVARHEKLELILDTLCKKSQLYNSDMLCSILRLNNQTKTLHPTASVSLPQFYNDGLEGVHIGSGVGSCGTAAFLKERVIVEDINTHPYWNQYKALALKAGLHACWSEPIIGEHGIVLGTFAMYYRQPKKPTEEDLKFIELSANLAAVVFENHSNREKLLAANNLLNQTINEQTDELKAVNLALTKALEEQNKQHYVNIKNEKMLATNILISGFSHEVSTPVGIALTAISAAEDKLAALKDEISHGTVKRSSFITKSAEVINSMDMSKSNLLKVHELLLRFKDVNTATNGDEMHSFPMKGILGELKSAFKETLGTHQLSIHSEDFKITCNKESLWQVFYHLIDNSIVHGFEQLNHGVIHINVAKKDDDVIVNYQDNGCGISSQKAAHIFDPFYTSARNKNNLGLGLSITHNLITHNLQGQIRLLDSPTGVRYEFCLPANMESAR